MASRVLKGLFFGLASWSRNETRQFAIERDYGGRYEICVASLDPNVTTLEALGPGLTIEEHWQEMVDFFTRRVNADPEDAANYLSRAVFYIYLQEYGKATADLEEFARHLTSDSRPASTWFHNGVRRGLATWGIEKYREGAYDQSLATLTILDRYRFAGGKSSPAEAAIIAMSLRQLGQDKEAELVLEQLRGMFGNANSNEFLTWLCRAEKLFAGDNASVRQVWELIELGKLNDTRQLVDRLQTSPLQQDAGISGDMARATRVLAGAYYERGRNAKHNGAGYGEAISDYEAAVRVDPNYAKVFNDLGWLLAACPETEFRNDPVAIENAVKACELTGWKDHRYVGTLAAIYAEIGNFDNAVKYQKKAADLVAEEDGARWQAACESRLKLYQSGKTCQGGNPWSLSTGGMVAHWDFENSDGRVVRDSSGNGLDGRLVGDAHVIDDPDRGGRVLRLDGNKDWVDCGKDSRFDITSAITVTCWIKVYRFNNQYQTIISKGDNAWRLSREASSNQLHFACSDVNVHGDEYGAVRGKRNANDGEWHHVVGVYDGLGACL